MPCCWRCEADPEVEALTIAPGNAGTASLADQRQVDITSGDAVVALAREIRADLVVIGPEVPLVLGVADAVRDAGIACFGPSQAAAQIEGSKAFAKDVMAAAGVRTASSEIVDSPAYLDAALGRFGLAAGEVAWVVKDDRLAAGKGVVVTSDREVARAHAAGLLDSGHPVLLESYLDGPEVSLFCVVDAGDRRATAGSARLQARRRRRHRSQYRRHGRIRAAAVATGRRLPRSGQ